MICKFCSAVNSCGWCFVGIIVGFLIISCVEIILSTQFPYKEKSIVYIKTNGEKVQIVDILSHKKCIIRIPKTMKDVAVYDFEITDNPMVAENGK